MDAATARSPRPARFQDRKLILAAGHYYPRKGYERLIEAFDRIATLHPDAVLRIVTEAPPSLHALAARQRNAAAIEIAPLAPHADLMQWMAWADLFAMPSTDEAFGLVAIEALAAGSPVLLSDTSGVAETLLELGPESGFGWTCAPEDEVALAGLLDRALRDTTERRARGSAGKALVERHLGWDRTARGVRETFQPEELSA